MGRGLLAGDAFVFPCAAWHRSGEKQRRTITVSFFFKESVPDPQGEDEDIKPCIKQESEAGASTDPLPPGTKKQKI